ncbi:hypothetical protein CPAR01_10593 [Colletotrichum paranaense]|uniref:NACHT domain-containing protein n=1 Tax=Colletotrichum paranaense TaxID=1914294 RepID=A0ABQ9SF49_9PEZI|nr:uncharacterized protein CPAR01_10593 [Colletotrichum paranaense]KAK1533885.1 hypothetical protein CPAR01_10593 [Colletotrichum paranaense]
MSFGFGVGDFIAVIDKLRHCHDRFSEAPELFVSLVRNVEIIKPLLEEARCPQQNLNDEEQKILEDIIEGSYKDLKRLKKVLDDCKELNKPLEKRRWDKSKLLQFLQRLQLDPKAIDGIQSSLSIKITLLNTLKNASDSRVIQSTKQVVDSMHHGQASKHQQEILEWLTPSDYSSQQRDYFSTRHPETASWLLESKEFEWVSNRGQTLLCRGMPGAGKTIMTSVVIDHLIHRFREEPRVGIAYVYCNFKDTERQDCHDLLSSLAKQLAQSCSPFPQSLETLYNTHHKRRTLRTIQETVDLLQIISSCYERVFIVVDALDECDRNALQAFLPKILRLQQRSQVNIFATTREIPEILESKEFENSISVEIRAIEEDVLRYTTDRMTRMQSFVRNNLDLQKEIRDIIAEKVDGMFLLARLLIDAWSNKLNPKELKKALKVFGETSGGPDVYSAVYDEAMNRIRSQPSEHVELALNVLSWTIGAKRPLTIKELQHALAVEEGETDIDQDNIIPVETMISVCAGLVTVSERSGGVIRLVHQTTQEYFERKRHQFFPDIDSQIAIACTNYLSIKNVYKLPGDYDSYEYDSDSDFEFKFERRHLQGRRDKPAPFFNYATLYWGEHTRESSIIPTEVIGFLRNQDARNRSASVLRQLRCMPSIPRTSAQVAAYFGILQLFTNYTLPEIDMYSVDESGKTALWWAAFANRLDVVKFYLDSDAIEHTPLESHSPCTETFKRKVSIQCFRECMRVAMKKHRTAVLEAFIGFSAERRLNGDPEQDKESCIFSQPISQNDVSWFNVVCGTRLYWWYQSTQYLDEFMFEEEPSVTKICWGIIVYFIRGKGLDQDRHEWLPHVILEFLNSLRYSKYSDSQYLNYCSTISTSANKIQPISLNFMLDELLILLSRGESFDYSEISLLDQGLTETLRLLLKLGANLDTSNNMGRIHCALALMGFHSAFRFLMTQGACVYTQDAGEEILTSVASMTGKESALSALMSGAVITERHDLNTQEPSIQNPASVDVEESITAALQLLVEMGADIGARDHEGKTPTYWAIVSRNIPALHFLLENNVEAEIESTWGKRPLLQAAVGSNKAVVEIILNHDADIEAADKKGRTALSWAAGCGNLAAVQLLLKRGTEVDVPDESGRTPLAWACAAEDIDDQVIRSLLAHGANSGIGGSDGAVWLYARHKFDLAIIDMFCQNGFDLCSKDAHGRTLLFYAAERGSAEGFKMILESTNLNLNSKDDHGRTVLWYAVTGTPGRRPNTEVVRMILDDPKVDHNYINGQEALIQTIHQNSVELLQFLATREDVSVNGELNGKNLMLYAAERGNLSIFMSLKECGAVWGQNQCKNVEILSRNLWRFKEIDEEINFKWSYHKGQLL